ncbi:unnamed protein product [Heligmosomoides polygyrus]|uniref:Uncharacterized protein n=1 Tax=Heligmosomoides polygyrus TaxID=6339 RepID=A0A3P8BDE2_HELPZ|nr:unnamed protein product [Heligmosomoides polygyrus]
MKPRPMSLTCSRTPPYQSPMLLRSFASLQFMSGSVESIDREFREKLDHVKIRYRDTAKLVIWPECRVDWSPPCAPPRESDPRTILNHADLEDDRSPYLPCTINSVKRSDSEDSSSAESVLEMTWL